MNEESFYAALRGHVFSFLCMSVLFVPAYRILQYYRLDSLSVAHVDEEEDEDVLDSVLPKFILTWSLAVSFSLLLWLPVLTICDGYFLSSSLLPYPFDFMNPVFIHTVKQDLVFLSLLAAYLLLPLSYFYEEACYWSSSLHTSTPNTGIKKRVWNAFLTWFLVSCLAVVGWWALTSWLGVEDYLFTPLSSTRAEEIHEQPWEIPDYYQDLPLFLSQWRKWWWWWAAAPFNLFHGWINMISAILALRVIPKGCWSIWLWLGTLPPLNSQSRLQERLIVLKMEEAVCKRNLEEKRYPALLNHSLSDSETDLSVTTTVAAAGTNYRKAVIARKRSYSISDETPSSLQEKNEKRLKNFLQGIQKKRQLLLTLKRQSAWRRNLTFVLLFILSTSAWVGLILALLWQMLSPTQQVLNLLLPVINDWGIICLLRGCLVVYVIFCYFLGLYELPALRSLVPRRAKTGTRRMVANAMLWAVTGCGLATITDRMFFFSASSSSLGSVATGLGATGSGGTWWAWMAWKVGMLLAVASLGWVERGMFPPALYRKKI